MSPCLIYRLTPIGLEPASYTADSLVAAQAHEPEGIYTITRTYHQFETLNLNAHLDRMEDSAQREGIPLQLDRSRLRAALREVIAEADFGDVRFRVTVPREAPDSLILSVEPFRNEHPPEATHGAACITVQAATRHNPAAKTTAWAQVRQQFPLPSGIYEGLLLTESGAILEGFSSNFYALCAGELWTAGERVLAGIARQVVLHVARPVLPLRLQPIPLSALPQVSETFITNSSRGIIPVIAVDGQAIGDGVVGPRTRALQRAYAAWVRSHLERL
jgi:branched-chain amino acid aminotransferase